MLHLLYRIGRAAERAPFHAALGLFALGAAAYAVAAPFAAVRYPPITDLPFHAAQAGALRHYFDPSFHFKEQFELQPIAVPYISMYVLGAVLMLFLPMLTAMKVASAVMIGLVPAGLAVLFHGLRKSPLLGLLGLPIAWCPLTHWGFFNHIGALGLFAMTIGLSARLVDRPTRGRQVALSLTLIALFFTHIFRFPFGLAAALGTGVVLYPSTRRLLPLLLPLLPGVALFLLWLKIRPSALVAAMPPLSIHGSRLSELAGNLSGTFRDPAEKVAFQRAYETGLIVLAVCLAAAVARAATAPPRSARHALFSLFATVIPLSCAAVFLALFLTLPMELGTWWYVYPREATSASLLLLGAFPDLPRSLWLKIPLTAALAAAGIGMSQVVLTNYAQFDRTTGDFAAITRQIPRAPKLLYLIFDHDGSTLNITPYIHLPAYVQAEKGGWLSFHFAIFGASPLRYRRPDEPGAVVPPGVPHRFEWRPEAFDLVRQAPFFDWFLVRRKTSPDGIFKGDPAIERVDHVGSFWLYRRK